MSFVLEFIVVMIAFAICGCIFDWWLKYMAREIRNYLRDEDEKAQNPVPEKERFRPLNKSREWWNRNHSIRF